MMLIHPKQRGNAAENHIQPHNHQAARSQVVPTSHSNDDNGVTSRQKLLFRKCLEMTFQKMASAVVVINDHLSLQNIHQCNTQALQVMHRQNNVCEHEIQAGSPSTHKDVSSGNHCGARFILHFPNILLNLNQISWILSLRPLTSWNLAFAGLFLYINPLMITFQSRVAREKIIGGAEPVLLTPLEAWDDDMFCGKWAESSLTKGIMQKPDV